MEGKEIVCERIERSLGMCRINKKEEYYEIELPVITFFNQQLITLRLYPLDDGYYVSTTDTVFDEYPEYSASYCKQYYDLFMENDTHYHYEIKREGAYLYKKYASNHSARHAVDDFVKFFVYLDDFMLAYWNKEERE